MKHRETHPSYEEGCYGCKLTSVSALVAGLRMLNQSSDVTEGQGSRAYARKIYEEARAAGKEDPIPANAASAAMAPAKGIFR